MSKSPQFIAVDTNVLLDIAVPKNPATDAVDLLREQLDGCAFIVLPTVIQELRWLAVYGDFEVRMLAARALNGMRSWGFQAVSYIPVGNGITECIADTIRRKKLLPEEERNDSLIVAEAALAGCTMIISSDRHMRDIPQSKLNALLKDHDVGCLEIVWPDKLQKRFAANG